jgi:hypothetical protein
MLTNPFGLLGYVSGNVVDGSVVVRLGRVVVRPDVPVALVDDVRPATEGADGTDDTGCCDDSGGTPVQKGPVGSGRAHGEPKMPSDAAGRCAVSPDPATFATRTTPNAMPAATPTWTAERGAQRQRSDGELPDRCAPVADTRLRRPYAGRTLPRGPYAGRRRGCSGTPSGSAVAAGTVSARGVRG